MTGVLGKYSFGMGDRFGFEGRAQLRALVKIKDLGIEVTPVWNKSHREHTTVKSNPQDVRMEADKAVSDLDYPGSYFVDADHININIIEPYIPVSNFFTIDVANYIGIEAEEKEKQAFWAFVKKYSRSLEIPGIEEKINVTHNELEKITGTFLLAAKKAAEVYETIRSLKKDPFHVEVSMDEVEQPQSPVELFFVLAALAFYKIPVMTIAPKFTGRFNKGIDYEGDLEKFAREFEEDILVISYAIKEFGLPSDLKLSIHSGSDKFSIYTVMSRLINRYNVGIHVKTAGTTWLEEITVLAENGTDGFEFAVQVYEAALARFDELTAPYPDVVDIDTSRLPKVDEIRSNGGGWLAKALRHDQKEEKFNPDLRQLMHCAYKIAAERGEEFFGLLKKYRSEVEESVTANLFEKHLLLLFKAGEQG